MNKPLRVLILEDNPVDAELMQMEMRQAGMAVTARVAEDEVSFIREFGEFTPDIILSDYDLPTYTGALALAEVQRRCPDVPFILVTGAVTEDRAIEILTSGAKDFVMKNRLHKLVSAMRRAIAEAEEHKARRKAEREAHAASLYARSLIEASLDPLVTISAEGKITDVNIATEEVTGFSRVQLIGTDFSDYFTDPAKARAGYEKVFSEGSVKDYPLAIRHVSGRITEVLYNASVYRDENGTVQGVFAAARDVTELKKAEEERWEANRTLEERVRTRTAELEAEVAARKEISEALQISERRERERAEELATILDAVPTPVILVHDADSNHMTGNRSADELLRLQHGSEISLSAPTEDKPRHFKAFKGDRELKLDELPAQRAARGEQVKDFDFSLVFNNGATRYLLGYGTPLLDKQQRPRGAVNVLVDITERKLAEDALKLNAAILETVAEGIFLIGLDDNIIKWTNRKFEQLFGYGPGEMVGMHVDKVNAPTELTPAETRISIVDVLRQAGEWHGEIENIRKDETHFWCYIHVSLFNHPEFGAVMVSAHTDITERKRAEDKLRESEKRFRALTTMAPVGVAVSSDGKFAYANPAYEKMLGYGPGELGGRKVSDLYFDPHDRSKWLSALREKGAIQDYETRLKKKDGMPLWASINVSPIDYGNKQGLIGTVRDITERKNSEEALKLRTAELESVVAELDSFAYSVSHDLRAPLRAIDGYSQMLLKEAGGRLDPDDARKLQMISKNSEKMGRLIDDLLQLSRTVRVEMRFGPISMKSVVEDTWREIRAGNPDRKMEIIIGDLPPARGDLTLLRQAFSNLIGNAVKFTKNRNKAVIHVTGFPADGFNTYCVRDNGAGFDMKYYDKLFEVFRRLHSESQYEGTGVGLAIVKKIVEKHGGRIWAESKPDEGAAFYLTLPA